MSLDDIVKKLRKVKYGDYVLADDHNDLVDAITLISKGMKLGFYSSDTEYSVYNEGKEAYYGISTSLYSKNLGKIDCYYAILIYSMYMRGWVTEKGQGSGISMAFHTKDHPAGEVITGTLYTYEGLPDYLGSESVGVDTTKPDISADGNQVREYLGYLSLPQDIYVVIWFDAFCSKTPKAYTAYVDKIRVYWNLFSFWE